MNSIAAITNQSAISTLTNARGGNGTTALTYTGALPSNYFTYVTSTTQYGQLNGAASTGSMTFGLASGSTLGSGTYANVITGVNDASVSAARTGAMNGFMWRLVLADASVRSWNLVVSSATLAPGATQTASNLVDNVDLAFQGSSLRIDRPGVVNNNIRVSASTGNTIDLSANTATFTGVISDAASGGAIGFSGGGTAIITGANTYTGATAIEAGTTVQVGDGGVAGSLGTGAVVANGTLVVNRTDSSTVANNISGAGGLTVAGSGVTTLSGVNTFSGGLVVTSGATVAIPSSAALGSGLLALVGSPTVPGDPEGHGDHHHHPRHRRLRRPRVQHRPGHDHHHHKPDHRWRRGGRRGRAGRRRAGAGGGQHLYRPHLRGGWLHAGPTRRRRHRQQ